MRQWSWIVALAALHAGAPAEARQRDTPAAPTGQITFLYYKDLPAAARFYERLLGRPPEVTPDWVRLFPIASGAKLGLVNATGGALRPSDETPVMVTIVVDAAGAAPAGSRGTRLDARRSIRAFMINDPEGYRVEILTWLRTPPG